MGTKNPSLDAVKDLRPDVLLANMEENRDLDAPRLLRWPTPPFLEEAVRMLARPVPPLGARKAIPIWRRLVPDPERTCAKGAGGTRDQVE